MNVKPLICEFVGTFALCFVGILTINHLMNAEAGLIGIALAHGLVIACFASAAGPISGGHLNPAVTLGLLVGRQISAAKAVGYIVVQLIAGLIGALAAQACLPGGTATQVMAGTPALGAGIGVGQGILAEAIATFFFVFVIYGTAVDPHGPKVGALFIGLTLTLSILAIGPLTGGALNPARYLGPAIVGGDLKNAVVYFVGPILGATVAGLLYSRVLAEPDPA